jgi:5-methylcytosine-specific restriction endonuclease McrA
MIVYVLHQDGTPLMPTKPAKARHLLRAGKAVVANTEPFTIQLTAPSGKRTQPITVGVDLGAKTIGVAAVGNDRVLYQGEVTLRTDVHRRMETRAMYRRTRRSRKLRYRSPRFSNRAASRCKGRLPPSIRSRSDTTIKAVRRVARFLPVSTIVVETANFDTQAMRNEKRLPNWAYQRGPLYGEENIKMYVRARDRYICVYCGERFPTRLEVDHVVPRSRGGPTTPDNLVASCHDCNQRKGNQTAAEFGYPNIQKKVRRTLAAAAHTQAGKTATIEGLGEIAPVELTYGYVTKIDRQNLGLPKTHYYDAVAIACKGQPVKMLPWREECKAVSRGAYQQRRGPHSQYVARLPYEVFGFRQWDKVQLPDGTIGYVKSRRKSGSFRVCDAQGKEIKGGITYKKLKLLERASTMLVTYVRDMAVSN